MHNSASTPMHTAHTISCPRCTINHSAKLRHPYWCHVKEIWFNLFPINSLCPPGHCSSIGPHSCIVPCAIGVGFPCSKARLSIWCAWLGSIWNAISKCSCTKRTTTYHTTSHILPSKPAFRPQNLWWKLSPFFLVPWQSAPPWRRQFFYQASAAVCGQPRTTAHSPSAHTPIQ